ncbi:Uncharacterised protein [Vibrio cholerae]|nr:Uncharacterised protein [Vibrio cholerae]
MPLRHHLASTLSARLNEYPCPFWLRPPSGSCPCCCVHRQGKQTSFHAIVYCVRTLA